MKKQTIRKPRPKRIDYDLLAKIERAMAEQRLSPSAFGLKAAGDPGLVDDLKEGRNLGWYVRERVENFMRGDA